MKKYILVIAILAFLPIHVFAEKIVLDSPEAISPPEAAWMDWFVDDLDSESRRLVVKYRWRSSDDKILYPENADNGWLTWTCQNISEGGDNDSTCFSDVFSFKIREQDTGTSIGVGLRTLIWNRFRQEILPTNNGTFQ